MKRSGGKGGAAAQGEHRCAARVQRRHIQQQAPDRKRLAAPFRPSFVAAYGGA